MEYLKIENLAEKHQRWHNNDPAGEMINLNERTIMTTPKLIYNRFKETAPVEFDLRQATFKNCVMENGFFQNTDFANADFTGTKLQNTEFENCNFSNANLSLTDLSRAKFINCNLENAILNKSNLKSSYFDYCSFKNADMSNTDGYGISITNSDFTKIKLKNMTCALNLFDKVIDKSNLYNCVPNLNYASTIKEYQEVSPSEYLKQENKKIINNQMESLKDRRLHNKISQLPKEGLRLIEGKKIDLSLTKNRKEKREIPKLSIVEPHSHENRKEQKKHER